MKVLLINSDSGYGSTGRITNDLFHAIIQSGNEALIGYGRECTDDAVNTIKIGNQLDVYIHVLKTRLFDLQGFGSVYATKNFIKKCKAFHPDVIHLHNIHGSYINIQLLFEYIKELKVPVIWTLHDCWAFTGHCAYYTYVGCDQWHDGCKHCIQKKCYPTSYFLDHARNNFIAKKNLFTCIQNLRITTVSNWLMGEVKQSMLKEYDVSVIPNGIDLTIFKPTKSDFKSKYHLENKTILLGVASIWHDRKGLWLFNELAEKLDGSYQIVLVGITQKQKAKLSNRIFTIERTNNINELAELYSIADIFLNPSVEETFGMVSLEALACGTQVISNQYSANPELINEQCGIIVNEITVEAFMNAIQVLKLKPKDSRDCIRFAEQYDKNKCYQAYLNLYQESVTRRIL